MGQSPSTYLFYGYLCEDEGDLQFAGHEDDFSRKEWYEVILDKRGVEYDSSWRHQDELIAEYDIDTFSAGTDGYTIWGFGIDSLKVRCWDYSQSYDEDIAARLASFDAAEAQAKLDRFIQDTGIVIEPEDEWSKGFVGPGWHMVTYYG